MWFNTRAAPAEIEGTPAAAIPPDLPPGAEPHLWDGPEEAAPRVAIVASVAASLPEISKEELARDLYEERAAIREFDGRQSRTEAEAAAWQEAMRAAGITALDEWRQGLDGNRHRQRARKMEGGQR